MTNNGDNPSMDQSDDDRMNATDGARHPFDALGPDLILDAVESTGLVSDARLMPLASYENRVYQVGLDDGRFVVVKFYRPGRWSAEQILEEHAFALELADAELPVIAPLLESGSSLHQYGEFGFALYPRQGGHAPALDDLGNLYVLGRTVGRIHAIGAIRPFNHRPAVTVAAYAEHARAALLGLDAVHDEVRLRYEVLSSELIDRLHAAFDAVAPRHLRLHGDCHVGNILWRDDAPHFVDFDDARNGPAVQDLWLFMSGPVGLRRRQAAELVEGYEEFHEFDRRELALIEPLRALRFMHHAAWLASRWDDPAFPPAFPWFGTQAYWVGHVIELEEQLATLDAPPLSL